MAASHSNLIHPVIDREGGDGEKFESNRLYGRRGSSSSGSSRASFGNQYGSGSEAAVGGSGDNGGIRAEDTARVLGAGRDLTVAGLAKGLVGERVDAPPPPAAAAAGAATKTQDLLVTPVWIDQFDNVHGRNLIRHARGVSDGDLSLSASPLNSPCGSIASSFFSVSSPRFSIGGCGGSVGGATGGAAGVTRASFGSAGSAGGPIRGEGSVLGRGRGGGSSNRWQHTSRRRSVAALPIPGVDVPAGRRGGGNADVKGNISAVGVVRAGGDQDGKELESAEKGTRVGGAGAGDGGSSMGKDNEGGTASEKGWAYSVLSLKRDPGVRSRRLMVSDSSFFLFLSFLFLFLFFFFLFFMFLKTIS